MTSARHQFILMYFSSFIHCRIQLYNSFNLFVGLSTVVNPWADQYWHFVVLVVIRGVFAGILMSQRATIVEDIVGKHKVANAFGLLLFMLAIGSLLGRALGGEFTAYIYIHILYHKLHIYCSTFISFYGYLSEKSVTS